VGKLCKASLCDCPACLALQAADMLEGRGALLHACGSITSWTLTSTRYRKARRGLHPGLPLLPQHSFPKDFKRGKTRGAGLGRRERMEGTEVVTTGDRQGFTVRQPRGWQSLPSPGAEPCRAWLDARVRRPKRGTRGASSSPSPRALPAVQPGRANAVKSPHSASRVTAGWPTNAAIASHKGGFLQAVFHRASDKHSLSSSLT